MQEAESAVSSQQHNNFKMVLVNNKPMHSWYNWLTAAGVTEDQVEVSLFGTLTSVARQVVNDNS